MLTSHSSELAAVLLRDRPGASLEAQQELWMGWGWVMGMEMGGEGETIWSSLIFFGDLGQAL